MPASTACPTVPEILTVLHSESTLDQVVDLARHLVTCPTCTDTLNRLNITDSVIDRLRAVQMAGGGVVDGEKIDGLILALRAATGGGRSTPETAHTVDGSPAATAAGEEDWHSLLSPPVLP